MADVEKVIKELEQLKHCLTKPCDITCSYYNAEDMICPCEYDVSCDVAIDNAIQFIRELQAQIPKWHLCSEELPKKQNDILLFLRSGEMSTGMLAYTDGYFYADCISTKYVEIENVIAWMELPKFEEVE